jgi:hypothetical protein
MHQLEQAGVKVDFWYLLDNDLLPKETAEYVPTIEAFALILENYQQLRFPGTWQPPQNTESLDVPPGTRLGIVARATSMSVARLRSLNRDILVDYIPKKGVYDVFQVQVPRDSLDQAAQALKDLLARDDQADVCYPAQDWGREPYTPKMADECQRKMGAPAPPPRR